VCCLYIGENSVEVKVEADDIPKCSHYEQPDNGMLDLYCYKCKKTYQFKTRCKDDMVNSVN